MRVESFSTGYYLTEMYVEPGGEQMRANMNEAPENPPRVNDEQYRTLQKEVLEAGDGQTQIYFHIDQTFFEVEPSANTPTDVLELPDGVIEQITLPEAPARRDVMIPKPWFIKFLKEPDI